MKKGFDVVQKPRRVAWKVGGVVWKRFGVVRKAFRVIKKIGFVSLKVGDIGLSRLCRSTLRKGSAFPAKLNFDIGSRLRLEVGGVAADQE